MSVLNNVCVKVERPAKSAGALPLRLFMQSFEIIPDINVPYEQIIDTMRILFGSDVIITFSSELIISIIEQFLLFSQ